MFEMDGSSAIIYSRHPQEMKQNDIERPNKQTQHTTITNGNCANNIEVG
jgi:hypothetical protein